ncbi:MAG: ABC transporter substrate-binding protein [Jatrophihabitantaceae bacterium]
MRVHKGTALIAGAAAFALALTGCSSSSKPSGGGGTGSGGGSANSGSYHGAGSGTMIWGESTDFPENLLPLISAGNATSTANLEVRVLDGAYRTTPKITYEQDNDQITSGTSSMVGGQQVVDFKINPKAVWGDGQPITSADYIFTWQDQKSTDPKKGGCADLLSETGFDQIASAKAVSSTEVQFTFIKGKPFADWRGLFASPSGIILSKHIMDKGSPTANCAYLHTGWPTAQGIPLGAQNGPWLLETKNINVGSKTFTLTHNPRYWGNAPKLARLVDAYVGSDSNTNVKALQNQEVNVIYPQPQLDLVKNLQGLANVTTQISFGVAYEHLDFNVADPLLKHKEIREAIAYAVDRPALVNATVGKFSDKASVLGNRLILTNQPGYQDHSGAYAHQDIAKSKQLLQSVGCTMGSGGVYTCFGKPLSFQVETTQNNPLRDQTIQTIASQVKAAGIKLTEFASPDIFAGTDKPHSLVAEGFQIALFAWVGTPSISSNAPLFLSPAAGGKGQNYTQGGTPQLDTALNQMSTSATPADEVKYANVADQLIWDNMFTLPLYQKPTLLAFDSNVKGLADNATSAGPLWNSDTFTVS